MQKTLMTFLALIAFVSVSYAIKPNDKPIQLRVDNFSSNSSQQQGTSPLVIDDGTAETSIGDSGQMIWFNRFTPAPADFPFQLEDVSIMFGPNLVNVGDAIEIVLYEDSDGDPGTGAVLLDSITETVQFNDQLTFSVYTLASPVEFTGPGDVLIGVVNRAGSEGFDDFPASLDSTISAGRSWVGTYNVGDVPASPTLPADEQWGTIDSFGLPGNWMIRGAGSPTPVDLMNFSVE